MRQTWPDRPGLVAIDGKTSRRSHDSAKGKRHCIWSRLSLGECVAFVRPTASRLVLGQEAVADKSNEIVAIPALVARLAENGGLKGALVSIDAIAANAASASAISPSKPISRPCAPRRRRSSPEAADIDVEVDKGHGRIEQRIVSVAREVDWLAGDRRFPGELRLPAVAVIIKVQSRAELKDRSRFETRYYTSSTPLTAKQAAEAVRGHWGIESAPQAHEQGGSCDLTDCAQAA